MYNAALRADLNLKPGDVAVTTVTQVATAAMWACPGRTIRQTLTRVVGSGLRNPGSLCNPKNKIVIGDFLLPADDTPKIYGTHKIGAVIEVSLYSVPWSPSNEGGK